MKKIDSKKDEYINLFFRIVIFFTIGCFVGVVFETILCYFQRGYIESRKGLIYGPFNAVYGFGIAVIVLILEKYKKNYSLILMGTLLGGIIEYFCSWIQEAIFGTTSWNYSNDFMNFDGRTSILHMLMWGLLSFLFMKLLYPHIVKLIYKVKENKRFAVSIVITIFFIINMLISAYANIRQSERIESIKATNDLQKFFDKHYPDELVNKVYPNRRDAKTNEKIK